MEEKDVPRADLARFVGITPATATDWFRGRVFPRDDKIDKLCKYFNCRHSDLLEPTRAIPELIQFLKTGDYTLNDKAPSQADRRTLASLLPRLLDKNVQKLLHGYIAGNEQDKETLCTLADVAIVRADKAVMEEEKPSSA